MFYGQDLKNEQWIIEPLANMVISLSIMDTGFKRYIQIDKGQHKDETQDILSLSIVDHFENCHKNGLDIINELFTGEKFEEKAALINQWRKKTKYIPKRIQCQKRISETLYEHGKYYLD